MVFRDTFAHLFGPLVDPYAWADGDPVTIGPAEQLPDGSAERSSGKVEERHFHARFGEGLAGESMRHPPARGADVARIHAGQCRSEIFADGPHYGSRRLAFIIPADFAIAHNPIFRGYFRDNIKFVTRGRRRIGDAPVPKLRIMRDRDDERLDGANFWSHVHAEAGRLRQVSDVRPPSPSARRRSRLPQAPDCGEAGRGTRRGRSPSATAWRPSLPTQVGRYRR